MEKLELKHIVGYLAYGLNFVTWHGEKEERVVKMVAIDSVENYCYKDNDPTFYISAVDEKHNMRGNYGILEVKPILRPMSDLTKEIEVDGEKFVPVDYFLNDCEDEYFTDTDFEHYLIEFINPKLTKHHLKYLPFGLIQKLYEWHFDLNSLIEKNIAVDMNTISKTI